MRSQATVGRATPITVLALACLVGVKLDSGGAQGSRPQDKANEWVVHAFARHHVEAESARMMMQSVHPEDLLLVTTGIYASSNEESRNSESRFLSVLRGIQVHELDGRRALPMLADWYSRHLRGRGEVTKALAKYTMQVWPCCDESIKRRMLAYVVMWCDDLREDAEFKSVMDDVGRVLAAQSGQPPISVIADWALSGPQWLRPYAIQWCMTELITDNELGKLAAAYWGRDKEGRFELRKNDKYLGDVARIVTRAGEARLRAEGLCVGVCVMNSSGLRDGAYRAIISKWYECLSFTPDLIRLAATQRSVDGIDAAVWVVRFFVRADRIRHESAELEAAMMEAVRDAETLVGGTDREDVRVRESLAVIRRMLTR